jgi:hypothetical protein
VTLTVPIHMHIIGTFATGQQRGILIIWSPEPIGSFATTECKQTGQDELLADRPPTDDDVREAERLARERGWLVNDEWQWE